MEIAREINGEDFSTLQRFTVKWLNEKINMENLVCQSENYILLLEEEF